METRVGAGHGKVVRTDGLGGLLSPCVEKPVCLSELLTSLLSIGASLEDFLQSVFRPPHASLQSPG